MHAGGEGRVALNIKFVKNDKWANGTQGREAPFGSPRAKDGRTDGRTRSAPPSLPPSLPPFDPIGSWARTYARTHAPPPASLSSPPPPPPNKTILDPLDPRLLSVFSRKRFTTRARATRARHTQGVLT